MGIRIAGFFMEIAQAHVKTVNPYRAGNGLFPTCLAGRAASLEIFSNRLFSTITGSPRNVIVYGNKRMGKTCMLIKMEQLSFTKKLLTVSTITSPKLTPMRNHILRSGGNSPLRLGP